MTQESINLARDEFVSSHRPKVILREAFTGTYVDGEEIVVLIHIANVGETGAIVQHSQVSAANQHISEPWPGVLPTVTNHTDLGVFPLAPGESRIIRLKEQTGLTWNEKKYCGSMINDAAGGHWERPTTTVILTGQILYVDEMGKRPRRTAFRRKLDFTRRRFYRVENEPDFEYAD